MSLPIFPDTHPAIRRVLTLYLDLAKIAKDTGHPSWAEITFTPLDRYGTDRLTQVLRRHQLDPTEVIRKANQLRNGDNKLQTENDGHIYAAAITDGGMEIFFAAASLIKE